MTPPVTIVWPALFPPAARAQRCAEAQRMSTSFPLPRELKSVRIARQQREERLLKPSHFKNAIQLIAVLNRDSIKAR